MSKAHSPEIALRLAYEQARGVLDSAIVGGRIQDFTIKQSMSRLEIQVTFFRPADSILLSDAVAQCLLCGGIEERPEKSPPKLDPAQQIADEVDAKILADMMNDIDKLQKNPSLAIFDPSAATDDALREIVIEGLIKGPE